MAASGNTTLPICFFKIILQNNLQTMKIPNKFTRSYGVGLPNPLLIKPPDGTAWKVYWKNINGEIWFKKGWKGFTQNYSLQHGCLVVFKYKEGSSELDVVIYGQNALEIDYDPSCDYLDEENDNVDDSSDDESVEILNEWPNHKKVRGGEIEKSSQRTSLNRPLGARAREVAAKFISCNPFFTISINPANLVAYRVRVPNLKGVIENKEKYVVLEIGKRSWNVKLLRFYPNSSRRLSAGWPLFASQSRLQPEDVCVFELINKQDLVFKVHVFKRDD